MPLIPVPLIPEFRKRIALLVGQSEFSMITDCPRTSGGHGAWIAESGYDTSVVLFVGEHNDLCDPVEARKGSKWSFVVPGWAVDFDPLPKYWIEYLRDAKREGTVSSDILLMADSDWVFVSGKDPFKYLEEVLENIDEEYIEMWGGKAEKYPF